MAGRWLLESAIVCDEGTGWISASSVLGETPGTLAIQPSIQPSKVNACTQQ